MSAPQALTGWDRQHSQRNRKPATAARGCTCITELKAQGGPTYIAETSTRQLSSMPACRDCRLYTLLEDLGRSTPNLGAQPKPSPSSIDAHKAMRIVQTRRMSVVRGSVLYLGLHLLGLLKLSHDSLNSMVPLLPGVLPGFSREVHKVHAYEFPVGLCSGAYGTQGGCRG